MIYTTFDPAALEAVDRYKLLTGLVVPRPIGWIGTRSTDGILNLAPFSFFNVVSASPATVLFSAGRRQGQPKDSLVNVAETREFSVNIVTEDTAIAMNLTSGEFAADIDEFAVAGLEAGVCREVAAPMVVEAAAVFECRLTNMVDIGDPVANTVVFGEVLSFRVRSDLLDGFRVDPVRLKAIGRMAGSNYVTTPDALFEMDRPD